MDDGEYKTTAFAELEAGKLIGVYHRETVEQVGERMKNNELIPFDSNFGEVFLLKDQIKYLQNGRRSRPLP